MTYSGEVTADSPAAWWRLGETSGTSAADSSGNGLAGTYTGSPTLGAAGIPGGGGDTAVQFASGKYVDFGNVLDLHTATAFSLEAWVKAASSASPQWDPIITKGDSSWRLTRRGANNDAYFSASPIGDCFNAGGPTLFDNVWHHIVGVYDGAHLFLYVDGAQSATTAVTGSVASVATSTCISRNADATTRFWNGSIDEAAVYTHALSAARVLAHYNAGKTARLAPITLPAMTALNRAATR